MLETLHSRGEVISSHILDCNSRVAIATNVGIRLFNITGKLLSKNEIPRNGRDNHYLVFSKDGRRLMLVLDDEAIIFDDNGMMIARIKNKQLGVNERYVVNANIGTFMPCGNYVLLSFSNDVAGLYDFEGNLLQSYEGHDSGTLIYDISVSDDGKFILTGANDSKAILWDLRGNSILEIQESDAISAVSFSDDGQALLIGNANGELKIYDSKGTKKEHYDPEGFQRAVTDIGFSSDSQHVKTFSGRSWRLMRPPPSGDLLADQYMQGSYLLSMWGTKDNQYRTFDFRKELARHYAVSQDFESILIGYDNPNAQLFKWDGLLLQNLYGHNGNIVAVAITPDGQRLATVTDQASLYLWERKKAYSEFRKEGNYAELTPKDLLRFEILDFDDILSNYDGKDLYDIARHYLMKAILQDHSQQIFYLEKAHLLLWKLNQFDQAMQVVIDYLEEYGVDDKHAIVNEIISLQQKSIIHPKHDEIVQMILNVSHIAIQGKGN